MTTAKVPFGMIERTLAQTWSSNEFKTPLVDKVRLEDYSIRA